MLGYTIDDLDKMSNAVHNSYKYLSDPNDKEGVLMAQQFLHCKSAGHGTQNWPVFQKILVI